MCATHSGVDCGGTEVCQEAAGKILGNLHGTGGFLSGKSAGTCHVKDLSGGRALREKDGRGGGEVPQSDHACADYAAEFDQRDGSGSLWRSGARHHLKRA